MDSMIFDVDGTLWDATEIVAAAWTQTARQGYDPQMTITAQRLRAWHSGGTPGKVTAKTPEDRKTHSPGHPGWRLCGHPQAGIERAFG